jgi:hypothetical protein
MNRITIDISNESKDIKIWHWLNTMLPPDKLGWDYYSVRHKITYIICDYIVYKTFLLMFL